MIRKNKKISFFKTGLDLVNRYRWQILIFIGLIIFASVFFPRGRSLQFTYQKDDIARETVIAPLTFPILKPEGKLQEDLDKVLKSEPALFNRNQEIVDIQKKKIDDLFAIIIDIQTAQNRMDISTSKVFRLRYDEAFQEAVSEFNADSIKLDQLIEHFADDYSFDIDNESWKINIVDVGCTED